MTETRPPLRDSYEALVERGRSAFRAGDIEDAIALYRRVIDRLARLSDRVLQRRPDLHDLHRLARLELTGLLRLEGRYAEAIEVEEVLLKTHPDEANVWRTDLAVLRIAKGEVDAGLAELRALAEEDPDNAWRWLTLGTEARLEGRFAESRAALDQALAVCEDESPEDVAQIYYQRFRLFKDMGQLEDALAAWEAAVQRDAQVGHTVREVYTMLTDVGRYSDALRFVDRDENELQAEFQQGLIANMTGKRAEAKTHWQQVSELDPSDFEYGHDAWVESMLRLGKPIPALEWLQENLGQYGTVRLLVLSAIGWAMQRDGELAAILFQQAINVLRHSRPPKQKLDSSDWRLLDSLVADDEVKAALKIYFAVVDTVWDTSVSPKAGDGRQPLLRP